jgi:hypothetical protein
VRKEFRLLVAIVFASIVALFVFASIGARGAQNKNNNASPRGECEQQCTQQYQECRKGPNANQARCQDELKSCRLACKDTKASPSPTEEPTATVTVTPTPKG